ncbi:ABC transporter ATP-binding protein [Natrialbaceae archaeon A-CW1-1]
MGDEVSAREKGRALIRAAAFRPALTSGAIVLSVVAALLEGVGLSFILPIVELAQGETDPEQATGLLGLFAQVYLSLNIPFTLGYLVIGVSAIMTVRFVSSFFVGWIRGAIETYYIRHLQKQAFEHAMIAEVSYFDNEGSDDILNAIVTQSEYAGRVLRYIIQVMEKALLALMYLAVAMVLAPILTVGTIIVFGSLTMIFRRVLEAGYSIGDKIADANEHIQQNAQAGTQGIRDVKLFQLAGELISKFDRAVDKFTRSQVKYYRNESAISNFYEYMTAIMVFVLIYAALTFSELGLGALGVFLFAMFRLGPTISQLNSRIYQVEGELPHLVRTQQFIDELQEQAEPREGSTSVPDEIHTIAFNDVRFSYDSDNQDVLHDLSFSVNHGEFVAFVGPSGAGKSTIVSLLARMYEPDTGSITANETPISRFDISGWRSKIAVVRQDPHIFNDTLRRNITIGNRDATQEEVDHVCRIAQVDEFLPDLPNGYETQLGDNGVRLSGGQRQRLSIARALLTDSELLILDEATSDLDTSLEERVHNGIETLDRDYAMIVIAHRLSTVTNADRIYTMEKGTITEVGSHDQLVHRDGTYAKLYAMQST